MFHVLGFFSFVAPMRHNETQVPALSTKLVEQF